jgi:hypothetical protein
MAEQSPGSPPPLERQPWELYALVACIIAICALIMAGNGLQLSAWLLALLALGIGQALLLPPGVGVLGGLGVAVLWVLLRQAAGVWIQPEVLQSLLELSGVGISVALAVEYRRLWQHQQRELHELRSLQQLFVAGEVGTGLLPLDVAELRLAEEVDRAMSFKRPLGLLVVELEQRTTPTGPTAPFTEVYQAVARRLASASLLHDVPFRVGENRVGLLLPERGWDRLYQDAESVIEALRDASFLDPHGKRQRVLEHIDLHVGLGIYNAEAEGTIDLMRAANDSLRIGKDLQGVGETPLTAYAMPATPIAEIKNPLPGDEV